MPKIPRGHVVVGEVVGVFGIRGALKVEPRTDFPERFAPGAVLFLDGVNRKIVNTAWHLGQARIRFEGIETPEEGKKFVKALLTLPEEERPELKKDTFLTRDLIGLELVDQKTGEILGVVDSVDRLPMYDILVSGSAMVPCIKEFVKKIDLVKRQVTIAPLKGMFGPPEEEGDE